MPLTSTTGIFSGLDTASLIQQLIAVEREPVKAMENKKADYQAKISTFGAIKSSLSNLRTTLANLDSSKIIGMGASSSDTSVFTAEAASTAVAGTYAIKVTNIASAQTIYSTSFSGTTAQVADLSVVASQKLRIAVGNASPTDITIDSSNNTLAGLRDAINTAAIGASASIVDGGFTVDGTNNTLLFNDGSDRTATLTAGTYTAQTLAAEVKRAMEAANGGSDTYTVGYDTTNKKFTIGNNSGNTNALDILWEHASTTAESLLGFSATDHAAIAAASSATGETAVGGYRLFLTSSDTGTTGRISLKVDEDGNGIFEEAAAETDASGLSRFAFNPSYDSSGLVSGGTANLTQSSAALDAGLVMNGLTVSRSSNTITDLIDNVTVKLLDDSGGSTLNLTVRKKTEDVATNLNTFIASYNKAMSLVRGMSIAKDGKAVLLTGDSAARNMLASLRAATTGKYNGNTLAGYGMSSDLNGLLSLDTTVLNAALTADSSGVLATIDSMAAALDTSLKDYVVNAIPAKTTGLGNSIKSIDSKIANIDRRLAIEQAALQRKFITLEKLTGQYQQTGNFLTQQFRSLSGNLGGGN